ncbi:hypothetical protein [Luteimonas sp. TWI382]|uniref:hypothetical protein n=1 Tax=Luteimonas sp. TWI382 TaxID=3136776 RepID=UPI00320BAAD6
MTQSLGNGCEADCSSFSEFMLDAIETSLQEAIQPETPGKTPGKTTDRILDVLAKAPTLSFLEIRPARQVRTCR